MGLDTTYECYNGSYGRFHAWRVKITEAAGLGDLDDYYDRGKEWPDDPIVILLNHSDCDGEIEAIFCKVLAERLAEILPLIEGEAKEWYRQKTQTFIDGLMAAHEANDNVEFM